MAFDKFCQQRSDGFRQARRGLGAFLVSLTSNRFLVAALRSKEVADQPSFIFVLDAGKGFCAQPDDRLRLIVPLLDPSSIEE